MSKLVRGWLGIVLLSHDEIMNGNHTRILRILLQPENGQNQKRVKGSLHT